MVVKDSPQAKAETHNHTRSLVALFGPISLVHCRRAPVTSRGPGYRLLRFLGCVPFSPPPLFVQFSVRRLDSPLCQLKV